MSDTVHQEIMVEFSAKLAEAFTKSIDQVAGYVKSYVDSINRASSATTDLGNKSSRSAAGLSSVGKTVEKTSDSMKKYSDIMAYLTADHGRQGNL